MDFEYSSLSAEMKHFVNSAMDIYMTILNKEIKKEVFEGRYHVFEYDFTTMDKKLMSLFISAFLTDGELKELLSEYDDIKLNDLLSFVGISRVEDVHKLEKSEYLDFYNKYFREQLKLIIESIKYHKVKFITPEVILCTFRFKYNINSPILEYYFNEFLGGYYKYYDIKSHPMFKMLEIKSLENKSIERIIFKEVSKTSSSQKKLGIISLTDEINGNH